MKFCHKDYLGIASCDICGSRDELHLFEKYELEIYCDTCIGDTLHSVEQEALEVMPCSTDIDPSSDISPEFLYETAMQVLRENASLILTRKKANKCN